MGILTDTFIHVLEAVQGKHPLSAKRSPEWPKIRAQHLKDYPNCEVCGGTKKLQVHHKVPFHLDRSLELKPSNLITLCMSGKNGVKCHLLFGHLGWWKSFNMNVVQDAKDWLSKITGRPS